MNAFTGFVLHGTPFCALPQFQTRLYANWLHRTKQAPSVTPSWPAFRDAKKAKP